MRAPYSWLSEYVANAPDVDAAVELLTVSGTMVERVERVGVAADATDSFRVARIEQFEQHPDADRLRLVQVDDGSGVPRQIVCGASNFAAGDTVALVTPGGEMPDGTKIKEAKLRGVESHGMLLSERELGLSTEHDGIMLLPRDWQPGDHLHQHFGLGDTVLELEITGNRPDCLGMIGVARELATAAGVDLDTSALDGDADVDGGIAGDVHDLVQVNLEASDLCSRYMARAFVDVEVGPSPRWLKARLAHAGMRAINNVVDVTNYVMLVTGQPLHAFDADKLGGEITIRRAEDREPITTLDGVERTLDPSMLVIADATKPVIIAGVMGASDVEVAEGTTRIVLEAASFDGPSIQRTSRTLALRSESSSRFEKGLDVHSPEVALRYASKLLVELCGARMVRGTIDARAEAELTAPPVIALGAGDAERILGIEITAEETADTLQRLGYVVSADGGDGWNVVVPHWRMHDTTRPIDLVEELGRFRLDRIPSRRPAVTSGGAMLSRTQRLRRLIEDTAAGIGLTEVVTYGLVHPGTGESLGVPEEEVVRLANPMTVDHSELRTSMVPSHLEVVRRNIAGGTSDVAIFEIGRTFHAATPGEIGPDGLPRFARERDALGVLVTGQFGGGRWDSPGVPADIHAAVGLATSIAGAAGVTLTTSPLPNPPGWLHPGRVAELRTAGGVPIGWVGSLHPRFARAAGVEQDTHAFQIDLAALDAARPATPRFTAFSEFPPVLEDIAVVLADSVHAGDVLRAVRTAGGELLERAEVFDRYVGTSIPEGHHSLAIQLLYRAPDRTLTAAETAAVRTRVVAALEQEFGAKLRG